MVSGAALGGAGTGCGHSCRARVLPHSGRLRRPLIDPIPTPAGCPPRPSVTVTKAAAAPATYPHVAAATGTTTVTATLTAVGVPSAAAGAPLLPPGTGALQVGGGAKGGRWESVCIVGGVGQKG